MAIPEEFATLRDAMPSTVRQLLVDGADPENVCVRELLADLRIDPSRHLLKGGLRAHVMSEKALLDLETCAVLRGAVDNERDAKVDSVDGAADHQLVLKPARLRSFVGAANARRLFTLPAVFRRQAAAVAAEGGGNNSGTSANASMRATDEEQIPHEILVRRYSADTRPWIAFHADNAAVTVNVALSADALHEGGRLVAVANDAVATITRDEGEATVHDARLLHAVSCMRGKQARYSLILFFGNREVPEAEREEALFAHWVQSLPTRARQRLTDQLHELEGPAVAALVASEKDVKSRRQQAAPAATALKAATRQASAAAAARTWADTAREQAAAALRVAEHAAAAAREEEAQAAGRAEAAFRTCERLEAEARAAAECVEVERAALVATKRDVRARLRRQIDAELEAAKQAEAAKKAAMAGRLQEQARVLAARGVSLEDELLRRMMERRPELRAVVERLEPSAIMEALLPYQDDIVVVMDAVMSQSEDEMARAEAGDASASAPASSAPSASEEDVASEHATCLASFERSRRATAVLVPADGLDAPTAPPEAYATLAARGRLRQVRLRELRPTAAPEQGAVLSGVLEAEWYRFGIEDGGGGGGGGDAGGEGVSTLLRTDEGALVRLRVRPCPDAEAAKLTLGRRLSVLHVWLTAAADGRRTLRVDDAATLHHDVTAAALLDAIEGLIAGQSPPTSPNRVEPPPTPQPAWATGARVRVHGLKAAAQHNGKVGVLSGREQEGREHVRLGGGGTLLVKRANLELLT